MVNGACQKKEWSSRQKVGGHNATLPECSSKEASRGADVEVHDGGSYEDVEDGEDTGQRRDDPVDATT